MSTLWFDVMSRYCEDPDWSNLPGADRSGLELLSGDDDLYEAYRSEPEYTPKIENLELVKTLATNKKFAWLLPPEKSR